MHAESRTVIEKIRMPQNPFLVNLVKEAKAKGNELAAAGHSNQEIIIILAQLLSEKAPFLQIIIHAGTVSFSYSAEDEDRPFYPSNS